MALSPKQMKALELLTCGQGLSYAEIARQAGCGVSALREWRNGDGFQEFKDELKRLNDIRWQAAEDAARQGAINLCKDGNQKMIEFVLKNIGYTNPSTLFGGTWEQIKDTFLLAAGSTYAGGSTGGEATHTLTEAEMPKHNHAIWYPNASAGNNSAPIGYPNVGSKSTYWAVGSYTGDVGEDSAHNNMPPYLAVYVWKRTK